MVTSSRNVWDVEPNRTAVSGPPLPNAAREQGVEPAVLTAVQTLLEGRIDRGQGELGSTALIEAFRPGA
jgi:hypothetical protein